MRIWLEIGGTLVVLTLVALGFHWLAERILRGRPEHPAPRVVPGEPEPWEELDEDGRRTLRVCGKHNKP